MANKILKIFLLAFAGFLFAQNARAEGLEKIFYLPKYNAEEGVKSVQANWQKIDILAPQMHVVEFTKNGQAKITGKFGPKLKTFLSGNKMQVMPLIANTNFSQSVMHKLLTYPKEQDRVITGLIYLAKRDKYIGWQYDFENINYQDKDLYTAFVEKSYQQFKKNKLVLSLVAVPRFSDFEDTNAFKNWSGCYNYAALAANSDFISLMVYDDPASMGPVASLDFVRKSLDYIKDKIPPEKLSLGVPLYYWKWDAQKNKKLGSGLYKNVLAVKEKYQFQSGFDENLGVSWLSYTKDGKSYKIWYEDKQSLKAKLDLINENSLRGFSAWLLGGEDPEIWSLF